MQGELVAALTEDKVRLDGFFSRAQANKLATIDAAVIVHGLSGNFYKSRLLKHFANVLQKRGIHTLLVNTRGHDYLNSTTRMGRADTLGAAVEMIGECKYDLYAWVEFLAKQQFENVLMLGHSLGAIKSLLAQAEKPHRNVKAVAAYSPTKLSYDSLLASPRGDRFAHWIHKSQELVAEGRGESFLFVDFPFPTWMSANAYLAKYGDGDQNNWLNVTNQIQVPVLAAFGEREMNENAAFNAMKPDLQALQQPNFSVHFIPRADHFYSACFDDASQCLFTWLDALDP